MNNSTTLKAIFSDSCEKHGIPTSQRNDLIDKGVGFFRLNQHEDVVALGKYENISEFVLSHRDDNTPADNTADLTKAQLYNRIVQASNAGDMAEFRRLRKLYSAAV